jgi:acyl-CoA synthetase (AMP-forming)/AMP-acid ligase II
VNEWLGATSRDVWLRALPEFHVGGMSIHFRAELSGSRVVADDEKWDAQRFASVINQEEVTLTEASSQVATARPGRHDSLPPMELLPCWEARVNDDGLLQLRGAPLLSARLVRRGSDWRVEPAVDADGWFTTADRARLDGRIVRILGRSDRVIKVLGELVDLDRIEAALAAAGMPPGRGVVMAVPDDRAGMRPVLITDLGEADSAVLVAAANATLPPFSGISRSHCIPELPRSPLGKVIRERLQPIIP